MAYDTNAYKSLITEKTQAPYTMCFITVCKKKNSYFFSTRWREGPNAFQEPQMVPLSTNTHLAFSFLSCIYESTWNPTSIVEKKKTPAREKKSLNDSCDPKKKGENLSLPLYLYYIREVGAQPV